MHNVLYGNFRGVNSKYKLQTFSQVVQLKQGQYKTVSQV